MSSSWSPDSTYVPRRSKSYVYNRRTDSSVSYHSSDFCFPQERSPAIHGDGGKSRRQPAAQHVVDYEGRFWAPRRKYANVETERRRKGLREDRGHTSRNTWAYKRSRTGLQQRSPTKTTGLQQRSPTKTNAREQATQQRDQGFAKRSVEQRDPGLTQRGGGQREQGLRHLHGVQWENQGAGEDRAPAELSARALDTHDLRWEIQDLRKENKDLRLRLHRLEMKPVWTPVAIFGSLGVCIYGPASRHWLISYSPIHLT